MKSIERDELTRWKKLAEAATAGPWELIERGGYYYFKPPGDHRMGRKRKENAEFIAAARDAVPRLVAEVKRLKEMMYCERCGDCVEDPRIDDYGEGPYCNECLAEMEEEDTQ
jgi:hypothetical protein